MLPFQITTAILGTVIAATILYLVRKDHLHGPLAVWWLLIAVAVFSIGLFPQSVDVVGHFLGIAYPPTLVFMLGMGLILVKLLGSDLALTRKERLIRRLAQRIALLEARIDRKEDGEDPSQSP